MHFLFSNELSTGIALTGVFLQTLTIFPTILVFAGGFMLLALAATLNVYIRQAHPFHEK